MKKKMSHFWVSNALAIIFSGAIARPALVHAADPPAELTAAASQDGATMIVKVMAPKASDLDRVIVFLDTDDNADTGFNPPADPHFGFDVNVQADVVSEKSGDNRSLWEWKKIGSCKKIVTGTTAEFRFDTSLLKAKGDAIEMSVWQMSPDWNTRVAVFPAGAAGQVKVKLTASKATTDPATPAKESAKAMDAPHANASLSPQERLKQAKNYACYYGAGHVGDLSYFDAAILHTPSFTANDVRDLKSVGVVTVGYISLGEDETLRVGDGKGPGGMASWYFDRKHTGKPESNTTWNSYFANASDPLWQADRIAEAKRLCNDVGFDGIFLDTVDSIDPFPESRSGMIQLINELHAELPGKVIVMNRGFSLLREPTVAQSIDAVMFESFTSIYDWTTKTYVVETPQDQDANRDVALSYVTPAMKKYGIRALALDYCLPDQTDRIQMDFDRAVTFGMLPAVAPIGIDAVYDTVEVHGNADLKYLQQQASPEKMAITLDTARAGWPVGTTVRPSSCFGGYTPAAVVDGIADRSKLPWQLSSWASGEMPGMEQSLTFITPAPVTGGTIKITFATDNDVPRPSKQFRVETADTVSGPWTSVFKSNDNSSVQVACPLSATPFRVMRLTQEAGGGSTGRPDLMWVAQVEHTL